MGPLQIGDRLRSIRDIPMDARIWGFGAVRLKGSSFTVKHFDPRHGWSLVDEEHGYVSQWAGPDKEPTFWEWFERLGPAMPADTCPCCERKYKDEPPNVIYRDATTLHGWAVQPTVSGVLFIHVGTRRSVFVDTRCLSASADVCKPYPVKLGDPAHVHGNSQGVNAGSRTQIAPQDAIGCEGLAQQRDTRHRSALAAQTQAEINRYAASVGSGASQERLNQFREILGLSPFDCSRRPRR